MTTTQETVPSGPRIPLERATSEIGGLARPSVHQWATERPQRKGRRPVLGTSRAGSAGNMLDLNRRMTLTFDHYSSDSSSSSDDDEPTRRSSQRTNLTSTQNGRQGSRKQRASHSRPFSGFKINNEYFATKGKVSGSDGRLKLSVKETINSGYFAKTLVAGIRKHFNDDDVEVLGKPVADAGGTVKIAPDDDPMEHKNQRVCLNIVIIVIGSRGDIQPFLRIGKILKEDYGHRVRIATHPAFKHFVEHDSGLEFFSIGGDPSELMAFMVKNPGLIPNLEAVKEGEIGKRRAAMFDMFQGMWRACINSTDDESDSANLKLMRDKAPFVCDAIIANPPSFAPPHIAERLGVPLHMMFTFPYSPTTQFPHPLANIKASNVDAKYINFMTYPLVEMMTWQGLGDLINTFRQRTLCLEGVSTLWAPGQLYRLKVPYTYMWSPGLVPKPKDWGSEIEISGFVFLDLASSFKPPDALAKFLDAGPAPVYIGFGSIVVDDPENFTKMIFEAVKIAGVRALVSKGWGGFGGNATAPDNIFMLENTPHDWLFPRVSAVVHHGGAGTTAIGLKCARPTVIVPFFGDQPFWGAMVAKAKAGAHECIPFKKLTAELLAKGIKQCLTEDAKQNVQKIADSIAAEGDGALNAVRSFHRSLPIKPGETMRCSILPNHAATWRLQNTSVRLSPLAAELLVHWRKIKWNDLRLLRHYDWNDFSGAGEPLTGTWGAIVDSISQVATGVGSVPVHMAKSMKKREQYYEKRYRIKKRDKQKKETLQRANKDIGKDNTEPSVANGAKKNIVRNNDSSALTRQASTLSTVSAFKENLVQELLHEACDGAKNTSRALLRAPMRLALAITQGFHNAPRLYGDDTVRRPFRITGFHSGIRAGRDEFVYGIRDGVTGLWMQPYRNAKRDGVVGFARGVGFGVGGFVLKDVAALLGPGAYLMKGLDVEYWKKYQPTDHIRRARIVQGQTDVNNLRARKAHGDDRRNADCRLERNLWDIEREVGTKWAEMQKQIKKERKDGSHGLMGALLGKKTYKEGKQIPLKSVHVEQPQASAHAKLEIAKIKSAPARAGGGMEVGSLNGIVNGNEDVKRGVRKSDTAPAASTRWMEKKGKGDHSLAGSVVPEV